MQSQAVIASQSTADFYDGDATFFSPSFGYLGYKTRRLATTMFARARSAQV
jgi:hypothetical protein